MENYIAILFAPRIGIFFVNLIKIIIYSRETWRIIATAKSIVCKLDFVYTKKKVTKALTYEI